MGQIVLPLILFIYNTVAFQNLGVAILEIAILSRVVFWPFAKQQAHYSKKMADLAPHLAAIKEKHQGNQQALAQAQMELYKQHGVNPAGGCLPGIVQIVIMFALYGAISQALTMRLNTGFLIWDMAKPDAYHLSGIPFAVPGILVIFSSLTQYLYSKMMFPPQAPAIKKEDKPEEKKEKSDFASEFAEAQSSMIWMFPVMFLFLGTQWPAGLALYWTVSSIIAVAQQYKTAGLGGLAQDIVKSKALIAKLT